MSDFYGHEDAAIFQGPFGGGVPLPPRFDLGLLDGIDLREPLEVPLLPPASAVVVVADRPAGRVDDDRILPAGEFDE